MNTDDLIQGLVADEEIRLLRPGIALMLAIVGGAVVAAIIFFAGIGFRHDLAEAAHHIRFLFKFLVTSSLAVPALALVLPLARPEASPHGWALLIAPFLLVIACAAELFVIPSADWGTRLIGTNARFCLAMIPLLSVGPLACLMLVMRWGAPASPGLAGMVAGLAAAGMGATFYAAHCTDDSPLFVATWYSLASGLVVLAGFFLGRRVLRW
ncbi:NrsF family protein [Beijerinckia indica]|uniref:Extracytoplasmic function alternative sigma factor n=1 Tax=Beijerinckia indica subsp. indica (strain ATCC 9039 / DSM 1715 / NCIMB 8712) TaxID=395963 RepID=B2IC98_BEII9|nr:NrsF family protein [Beijerinckia indica]ACB96695.1 protein of unknown function DUF1109 [Beijerinckia indica subsp. indica ATCC 9039]